MCVKVHKDLCIVSPNSVSYYGMFTFKWNAGMHTEAHRKQLFNRVGVVVVVVGGGGQIKTQEGIFFSDESVVIVFFVV